MPSFIDSILPHYKNNQYYFFSGRHNVRYTHGVGTDKNYPLVTQWRGMWDLFPGPYDASLLKSDSKKYYFFKGSQYVRYTPGQGVDSGYPKNMADQWDKLWEVMPGPYDACFYASDKDKYYFFRGDEYVRYTPGEGVEDGYPKLIAQYWHGMPDLLPPPYDAVVQSQVNASIYYFFKGDQYVRYRKDTGVDYGAGPYPQSSEYRWPGIWQLKPYSALTLGAYTAGGPIFSVRLLENKTVTIAPSGALSLELIKTIDNDKWVGYTKIYRVNNMASGAEVCLTLRLDGVYMTTLTVKNAPAPSDFEPFSLAMGSCLADSRNLQLQIGTVEEMVNERPDFMVWNGDTSYYIGETTSGSVNTGEDNVERRGDMTHPPQGMFLRMFSTRHHPSVAKAMSTIPAISTWDDHDFGFNNSDSKDMTAQQIKDATEVFRTCWPNDYTRPQLDDSIEHHMRYGQTQLFVPDARTHRDAGAKKILGDAQLASLITAMTNSDAALKILVLGSQLIPKKSSGEGFHLNAPQEREALLNAFKASSFTGRVLVLSGDVHYSELSYEGNSAAKPTILEVTSSPMLLKSGAEPSKPARSSEGERIWSVKGNTYAMLTIAYDQGAPVVTIHMRNSAGNTAHIASDKKGTGAGWVKADAIWQANGDLDELT